MFCVVNKVVKAFISETFGKKAWSYILADCRIPEHELINIKTFPDLRTYQLAQATATTLGISFSHVLENFGKNWILASARLHFATILMENNDGFPQYLRSLNGFQDRILRIFPDLVPPKYEVALIDKRHLLLRFYASTNGLKDFVYGQIKATGWLFNREITIEETNLFNSGNADHEFVIQY